MSGTEGTNENVSLFVSSSIPSLFNLQRDPQGSSRHITWRNVLLIILLIVPVITTILWQIDVHVHPILSRPLYNRKLLQAISLTGFSKFISISSPLLIEKLFICKLGEIALRIVDIAVTLAWISYLLFCISQTNVEVYRSLDFRWGSLYRGDRLDTNLVEYRIQTRILYKVILTIRRSVVDGPAAYDEDEFTKNQGPFTNLQIEHLIENLELLKSGYQWSLEACNRLFRY